MATTKPDFLPEWALDDITLPSSGNANKLRPEIVLRNSGYDKGQSPAAEEFNWQWNRTYQWINYFEQVFNADNGQETLTGDFDVSGNLIVQGDLTVNGTTTTVNSAELSVDDNTIVLNDGETGAGVTLGTAGIEIERGSVANAELLFDEADDLWKVSTDGGATRTPIALGSDVAAGSRNYVDGLTTSNSGVDTAHDIDIAPGAAADASNTVLLSLPATIRKRIDATWTEGDGGGGRAAGVGLSANSWYRVFIIGKADGTVDAGFDNSATASNLLAGASGYIYYRRVGWVRTDGAANILQFRQVGDEFKFARQIQDMNQVNVPASRTLYTMTVPPSTRALINVTLLDEDGDPSPAAGLLVTETWQDDVAMTYPGTNTGLSATSVTNNYVSYGRIESQYYVDSLSRLYFKKVGGVVKVWTNTLGWTDTRGKE